MYERGDGLAGRRVEEVASDSRDFQDKGSAFASSRSSTLQSCSKRYKSYYLRCISDRLVILQKNRRWTIARSVAGKEFGDHDPAPGRPLRTGGTLAALLFLFSSAFETKNPLISCRNPPASCDSPQR
jgi:hypothetical protein